MMTSSQIEALYAGRRHWSSSFAFLFARCRLTDVIAFVVGALLCDVTDAGRLWKTLYMDSSAVAVSTGDGDCNVIRPIRNDDMSEDDYYDVRSDSWQGKPNTNRRPSECTMAFNLGDRLVSVEVREWWCNQADAEPFLALYDDCEGKRTKFLMQLNCSSPIPDQPIDSFSYCLTLYHYRGHVRTGYYFSLHVIANHEVFAFPAGGIAAIIICAIVVAMLLVKVACVISGYERRLPEMRFDDDQKQILTPSSGDNCGVEQPEVGNRNRLDRSLLDQGHSKAEMTSAAQFKSCASFSNQPISVGNSASLANSASILRYSRSPRSSYCHHGISPFFGARGTGRPPLGEIPGFLTPSADPDYEYCLGVSIDDPRSPTLATNAYTSPTVSPLWRQ